MYLRDTVCKNQTGAKVKFSKFSEFLIYGGHLYQKKYPKKFLAKINYFWIYGPLKLRLNCKIMEKCENSWPICTKSVGFNVMNLLVLKDYHKMSWLNLKQNFKNVVWRHNPYLKFENIFTQNSPLKSPFLSFWPKFFLKMKI